MDNFNVFTPFWTVLLLVGWTHLVLAAPTPSPATTTTTTTSPVSTGLPPTVPAEPHHQIYERLLQHTMMLMGAHTNTYRQFRSERFEDDPDITIDDIHVENIPNSNGLPSYQERFSMPAEEILPLHYNNTVLYERGIKAVYMDEESRPQVPSYLRGLHVTKRNLQMVRQNMERAMLKEGLHEYIQTTPITPCDFTENASDSVRNLRNLYVLQELHHYLPYATHDFSRIQHHYSQMAEDE